MRLPLLFLTPYLIGVSGLFAADAPPPACDPPPISLHLQSASVQDLARALSSALDCPITSPRPSEVGGQGAKLFTLDADKKPFWDIYSQLTQQQSLTIDSRWNKSLLALGSVPTTGGSHWGGFWAVPTGMTRTRTQLPQAGVTSDKLVLYYDFFIDPRIIYSKAHPPRITQVTDDQGRQLLAAPPPFDLSGTDDYQMRQHAAWQYTVQGPIGAHLSFKGEGWFNVAVTTNSRTFDDLAQVIDFAGQSFTFSLIGTAPAKQSLVIEAVPSPKPAEFPQEVPIQMKVADAAGHVWHAVFLPSLGSGRGRIVMTDQPERIQAPLQATLQAPAKLQEIHVPFEFKNLEIPP